MDRRALLGWLPPPLVGMGLGGWLGAWGGALLGAVGGLILAWGIQKGAVWAGARGAVLGAFFATLIGPGGDWLISGAPFGERLRAAVIVGALVGGLLGVRNFRPRNVASAAPARRSDD